MVQRAITTKGSCCSCSNAFELKQHKNIPAVQFRKAYQNTETVRAVQFRKDETSQLINSAKIFQMHMTLTTPAALSLVFSGKLSYLEHHAVTDRI